MATVELDPTAQTPRRRGRRQAIKLLVVANPDRSSSEEDTPVDIYFNNNSTAPSRPAAIRAPSPRRATSPPPTSYVSASESDASSRNPLNDNAESSRRQSAVQPWPERIIVSVTSDAENFVVVDVTQTNSQTIREHILSKLHIPDDLHASFAIYRTELGGLTIGGALNDNSLLIDCRHFGDDKGTLKFLAQRADAPLDSPDADIPAPLPPMPPSVSSFSPGTMGPPSSRPLVEYKRPSPPGLYRPPPLPRTPQQMTLLPALASGRYIQQQRPQSTSDALPPSLRSGPRPRAERLLTKYDRPLLSDLYRSSTSSQPIVPVTHTQPAHVPPQTKVISRDFGAAVREEDDEDESDENSGTLGQVAKQKSVLSASGAGSTAAATTVAPLVRRTATRRKGLRLSIDGSRPSNDTFMPSTLPLEVRKKTAANRVNGSGNRGEIPSRSPLLPYQNSSAPSSSSSNTHPQTEEVNEKLDQSFPNHDLGNPIINIPSGATSSVTEAPPIAGSDGPRINGPGVRQHKKSIRVVAAERKKMLDRTNAAKVQQSAVGDYATYVPNSDSATPQPDAMAPVSKTLHDRDIARPNKMSTDEMFQCLTRHGCPDLTESMNPDAYSRNYVASGGFGDIWKGQLRDGTAVAIKVWRFRALNEDPGKDIKRAMREIYNWSQLNHDNIQKLLGVVVFDERLGMVSKWMEGGNLQSYLENNPRIYRYPLCIQVAQGVEYLHDSNMIHGDLKAINVLVSSDNKLKLTDFDYSIMAESTLQFSQTTRMGGGTPRWMAPELALDEEGNHQRNKRTDIYALGMTFLEIITGTVPYSQQCRTDISVLNVLRKKQFPRRDPSCFGPDERGDRMWALLEQCWDHDPAARPVASQVTTLLQTLVKETELSHESNNGMFNSLTPQPDTIIHPNKMSTDEMFQCLTRHGCPDLAKSMNPNAYSRGYIASGGSGDIWKGELRDKTAVAIKVWRCGVINEDLGKDSKRAMREIYNWSQLNHDNIQKLLGVVVFDGRLGMVSKWMENGNLRQYLERNPHVDRYPLCMQVVQGMEYLHHRNMIHGDLKATSILVSPGRRLKLTNFDHSIMAESTLQFSQTTRMGGGTLRWMAPELVLDTEGNHQRNKQTDIYALGMTFLEMITGAVPYAKQCRNPGSVYSVLHRKQFPRRDLSFFGLDERGNRMWTLLEKCWDHDPAARPIASEVTAPLQKLIKETEPKDTA